MDRWQWVDAFRKADINTATLMNMSEEDFQRCCEFLIDSGLAPLSYLGKQNKSEEEEELDRIIEEANRIKAKKDEGRSTSYRYNTNSVASCINDAKYDVNNAESSSKRMKDDDEKEKDLGPKSYVWSDDNVNEANRVIHDKQEDEYNRLLKEELEKQDEENRKHVESMKQNLEEHNKEVKATNAKREAFDKFQFLGPEPSNGIQLAFMMPSGKRLLRRFNVGDLADDVFTFIEGQEEMYTKDELNEYSIKYNINQQLNRGFTLSEQGIEKKTLLTVILE